MQLNQLPKPLTIDELMSQIHSNSILDLNYSRADKMLKITKPCFSSF